MLFAFVSTLFTASLLPLVQAAVLEATDAGLPNIKVLAGSVEGASVDKDGNFYAVDQQNFLCLSCPDAEPTNFTTAGVPSDKLFLASSRHTKYLGTLVGNANGKSLLDPKKPLEPKYENELFMQPNDFTISRDEKCIFFSAQKYQANSTAGEDGAVGSLDTASKRMTRVPNDVLAAAGLYRTNGIDLSPDDKFLYVTSSANVDGATTKQSVFKFPIRDNCIIGEPEPFANLNDLATAQGVTVPAGMDPDGLRTDVDGFVYVTLNAAAMVLKINPDGSSADVIKLKTVANPSNLEIGGKDGKTLVIVGRCSGDPENTMFNTACADQITVESEGRAIRNLRDAPVDGDQTSSASQSACKQLP